MSKLSIDLNQDIELNKYDLVLCKLSGEQLQELHNIEEFEIKRYFVNIDEISFKIPYYINNTNGEQVKNELYDLVDGSMLVLLNEMQYFTLTKPEIVADSNGGIYKQILGLSREYEFAQKLLIGYEGVSRKLYDHTNQKDEEGLPIGFLNYIEQTTGWRVGYVNTDLLLKYRELNFSKSTYLQAFTDVQKTFDCIFQYDTINKVIDVYEVTQLGKHQGLLISDGNFIKNLNQTINHDEIKTRLHLYGKDRISIQEVNITGLPYIEHYGFYKNTKYMTQGLIDALNTYESFIQTKQNQFSGYLAQLEGLNDALSTRKIELTALNTELKIIESNIDIAIAEGKSLTALKSQETAKQNQINTKQNQINTLDSQINGVYTNITTLRNSIQLNNHFTEEQLKELDVFIREDEFSDSNYTDENIQELFDEGKKVLGKISYPSLQFNVNVEDFLSLVEGQHMWDRFILGDLVTIEHEELGFDIDVRLIGYTHRPDSNDLDLVFSNKNSVDDANIYLKDLLETLTTTSSTVDFSRFKWDKGEDVSNSFADYVDSALDLAKQEIVKAEGQRPVFDNRGLWLYKENPDGSIDPRQVRAVNNVIALTQDSWNTVSTAISPKGVVAETLFGKILAGAELTIETGNGDFKVDQNGVMIRDLDLQITQKNGRSKIVMNANDGIEIHSKVGSGTLSRKFYVDTNGKIQANDIEIGNTGLFKGSITIGTGNNVFKSDSNGIYLGNSNFSSAPFRVSMDGTLNATKGKFSGDITGSSGTFSGNLSGATISGGSINIGNGNFTVNNSGRLYARYAEIDGDIYADRLYLSGRNILNPYRDAIEGDYLVNVTADYISTRAMEAITINADQITAGVIDAKYISTDISQVNSQLKLGDGSTAGSIRFTSQALISGEIIDGAGLVLSASRTWIHGEVLIYHPRDLYFENLQMNLEDYINSKI